MQIFNVLSSSMTAMLLGPVIGWALSTAMVLLGMAPTEQAVPIFVTVVIIGWVIVMAQSMATASANE